MARYNSEDVLWMLFMSNDEGLSDTKSDCVSVDSNEEHAMEKELDPLLDV